MIFLGVLIPRFRNTDVICKGPCLRNSTAYSPRPLPNDSCTQRRSIKRSLDALNSPSSRGKAGPRKKLAITQRRVRFRVGCVFLVWPSWQVISILRFFKKLRKQAKILAKSVLLKQTSSGNAEDAMQAAHENTLFRLNSEKPWKTSLGMWSERRLVRRPTVWPPCMTQY